LFLTVLSHVRLPLEMGDRICEVLGGWVALFVGPDYYFRSEEARRAGGQVDESVETAIRAMEVWNEDLTWFIFMRHRVKAGSGSTGHCGPVVDVDDVRLAEIVF
jgi:hypothetical protein